MKKKLLVICFMLILCGSVRADSTLILPASNTNVIKVTIDNQTNVSSFNGVIDPFPFAFSDIPQGWFLEINPGTKKFILYTNKKKTPIPNGVVFEAQYTDVQFGTVLVKINNVLAANKEAVLTTLQGGQGEIKIVFREDDLHATAKASIGLASQTGQVVNTNMDGVVDITDVQTITNNLE